MDKPMTPGRKRVEAAIAANRRKYEIRIANVLRERGWLVFEPDDERIPERHEFGNLS